MLTGYLLFFITLPLFAQVRPPIQVIPEPKTAADFEHQFKGCFENSECDQVMGLQLGRWRELITKLKAPEMGEEKRVQFLELFRAKYGLPIEFYTNDKSQLTFRPMIFNSPCKNHNLKEKKILRGTAFIKALSKEKATVWRDQAQIEVPIGEFFIPQPVLVYFSPTPEVYFLPLDDQPLYLKNKEIHVLKDEDDYFYSIKIDRLGNWKAVATDYSRLSEFEDKRQEVKCPSETFSAPKAFGTEFCKTVWDEDTKKTVIVKMYRGCVI